MSGLQRIRPILILICALYLLGKPTQSRAEQPGRFELADPIAGGISARLATAEFGGETSGFLERGSRAYLVCRLTALFGPIKDQGKAYVVRDRKTGIVLEVSYTESDGTQVALLQPEPKDAQGWRAWDSAAAKAQKPARTLLSLIESTRPRDCETKSPDFVGAGSAVRGGVVINEPAAAFRDVSELERRILGMVAAPQLSAASDAASRLVATQRAAVVVHGDHAIAPLLILLRHPQVNVRRGAAFAFLDLVEKGARHPRLLEWILVRMVEEPDLKCRSNLSHVVTALAKRP